MKENDSSVMVSPADSRNQRILLGALFALSVADGLVTRFIITEGLGSEGNIWLAGLASSDALILVKIVGTLLAISLLWILHYRKPRMVLIVTVAVVCWYTLVVFWNVFVVVLGSR
ncbi:MAG: hypothetical protein C4542_05025 [Dehalococcoidia bacterium]|nr:MAG: hypothetical protein C4542_05025 [Dehalococcoidia bacterium]